MSKRILFFILFSWLASAAFPAFAQQKTDTVYTFRFVPQKDMFYVPWNGNDTELAPAPSGSRHSGPHADVRSGGRPSESLFSWFSPFEWEPPPSSPDGLASSLWEGALPSQSPAVTALPKGAPRTSPQHQSLPLSGRRHRAAMTEGVLSTFFIAFSISRPAFSVNKSSRRKRKKRWKTSIALLAPLA